MGDALPKKSLQGPSCLEQPLVRRIKVCKVCIYLKNPIRLSQDNCANVDGVVSFGEERLVLDPGDDVMQIPRDDQEDDR